MKVSYALIYSWQCIRFSLSEPSTYVCLLPASVLSSPCRPVHSERSSPVGVVLTSRSAPVPLPETSSWASRGSLRGCGCARTGMDSRLCTAALGKVNREESTMLWKNLSSAIYNTMVIIIDPVLGSSKTKLLMLNTKISEIILCLLETKGMEGEEKRKCKGSMFA